MIRKLGFAALPIRRGSNDPPPFDIPCRSGARQRLGDAANLIPFGVNLLRLPPGA